MLPSAIFMADSSSKEQVLVIIVPVGLPSELQQCAPEHFLVVDSGATVHCWWDAICTSRLKEQNCSIGGIDIDSRAVCITIGHLCGMTFCKNKSNNWSKVLITSGNHDAWVIPASARQLFSQIRAKIQGHRCILEGPNPSLIIGATGDFIPFVLEEQTQFCLLPMYPPPTSWLSRKKGLPGRNSLTLGCGGGNANSFQTNIIIERSTPAPKTCQYNLYHESFFYPPPQPIVSKFN